jgi:hypothetical protein
VTPPLVSWEPVGYMCRAQGCLRIAANETGARLHIRKDHSNAMRPNQSKTRDKMDDLNYCQFCEFVTKSDLNWHVRETHEHESKAAWLKLYEKCGPIEKRGHVTASWCHSTIEERPFHLIDDTKGLRTTESRVLSRGGEMGNEYFENAVVSGISTDEKEAATAVLRFMGMTSIEAGASTVPAALSDELHGFCNGVDDCPRSASAWLQAAGMELGPGEATEVLRLISAPKEEDGLEAVERDGVLRSAARRYLRRTRTDAKSLSGSLKTRIKANGLARKMMTEMFRVVQNRDSEDSYARMATRLLRFSTRVNSEQAGRFGLGEDHTLLHAGAALWKSVLDAAETSAHVHRVMCVFALRTLKVWDPDTRHAIWLPALSACYSDSGMEARVRPAHEVTPLLAALKYTVKCSATQELAAICTGEGGFEGRMRRIDAVLLAVDEDDPPNSALSVLTRISQVATAAAIGGRRPIVTWCAKNEHGFRRCAVVGRSELSIDVLASSLCASQTDARSIVRELLFESQIKEDSFVGPGDEAVFGDRVKRLMLSVRDDARADTVGMCWRNGRESVALFEGTDMVVVNRLAQDAALYNSYFSSCEDGARDNYSRYAESIKNLHRHIAFWAHAGTGGCPRGVELSKLLVCSTGNLQRGIYLRSEGLPAPQVYLAPQYDKSTARVGNSVNCYRFFPAGAMSEIVFAYITYVKPFESFLLLRRSGGSAARVCRDYLFTDESGVLRSPYVVRGFVTKSLTECSNGAVHMTFGELRHWHKAVMSQHLLTGDDETTKMVARSFGHSEDVGGIFYGTTAEVTRTGTAASFEAFRSHAERVHMLYSLGKKETEPALVTWKMKETRLTAEPTLALPCVSPSTPCVNGGGPPIVTSQFTTASISKLSQEISDGVCSRLEANFQQDKSAWTRDSQFSARKRIRRSTHAGGDSVERNSKCKARIVMTIRRALRNGTATVRCVEQMEAIELALENRHDFLLILPTGMGKSLTYIVPALLNPGKVTAVVVPTSALVGNAVSGCRAAGLSAMSALECIGEEGYDAAFSTAILVFSMEMLDSDDGQGILASLAAMRVLWMIVIDEAHVIWEWRDFRRGVRNIADLVRSRAVTVPIVGLTATASPATVRRLQETVCTWDVEVRASTVRISTSYRVQWTGSEAEAVAMTVRLARSATECKKAIIFCMTIGDCEFIARSLLAAKLRCMKYHGRLTAVEKEAADTAFRGTDKDAENRAVIGVCTAGYGLGLDISEVKSTIHFGGARSVSAFMQESGRAGRSGAPCSSGATCTVVVCEDVMNRALADRIGVTSYGEASEPATVGSRMDFPAVIWRSEVARFVKICHQKDECFRNMLHDDVDGGIFGPQVCLGIPGAELCHTCTAEMDKAEAPGLSGGIVVAGPVDVQTPVRQAAGTVAVRRAEDVTILQAFRNVVNELGDEGCGVCWVFLDGKIMRHLVSQCPTMLQHKLCFDCLRSPCWGTGSKKDCARMLKVPENSGLCFACGLGKIGGGEVHENAPLEFGNKTACRQRKMLRAALALWEFKRPEVKERFPELRLLDNRRGFVPALIADGSAPVPLLVLMIIWWTEDLAKRNRKAEVGDSAQKPVNSNALTTDRVVTRRKLFM